MEVMKYDLFSAAKSARTMEEVVRFYGFRPINGYICCPFHSERTPSCRLYKDHFYCFSCGAGGSIIDFVAKLFKLNPRAAVRKLNDDFNLQLPLERRPTADEIEQRRSVNEARQLFEEWRRKTLNMMDAVIRAANLADFNHLSDGEAEALVYREALEYWADILLHGYVDEQMQVFRERKEIERLCERIMNSTPLRSKAS